MNVVANFAEALAEAHRLGRGGGFVQTNSFTTAVACFSTSYSTISEQLLECGFDLDEFLLYLTRTKESPVIGEIGPALGNFLKGAKERFPSIRTRAYEVTRIPAHDYIDEFFPSNYVNKFQFTSLSSKVDNNGTATSQLSKTKFEASNIGRGNMYFVSKKIYFDRAENPWLADYNIDVSLVNCVPMTGGSNTDSFSTSHSGSDHTSHSTWSGVWVEKGWDHFTIYVGFQGRGPEESWSMSWQTTQFTPSDRTHIERFSTFLVPVESIIESDPNGGSYGFTGNPRMGLCVVPTIMWNMTVVPVSQLAHLHTSLGTQSTIKIKSI